MALNLATIVPDYLRQHPEQRFTAREIAVWIVENLPAECAEKRARSSRLDSEDALLQQLTDEIGSRRREFQRKHHQIKTCDRKPRKFYWLEPPPAPEPALPSWWPRCGCCGEPLPYRSESCINCGAKSGTVGAYSRTQARLQEREAGVRVPSISDEVGIAILLTVLAGLCILTYAYRQEILDGLEAALVLLFFWWLYFGGRGRRR